MTSVPEGIAAKFSERGERLGRPPKIDVTDGGGVRYVVAGQKHTTQKEGDETGGRAFARFAS